MFCQIWYLQYIDKIPSKYYARYRLYKHTDICLYLVNVQGGLKTTQYIFFDRRTKYYLYLHVLCQDLSERQGGQDSVCVPPFQCHVTKLVTLLREREKLSKTSSVRILFYKNDKYSIQISCHWKRCLLLIIGLYINTRCEYLIVVYKWRQNHVSM